MLIFVSSRRQTRLTALDLIAFLAADDNPKQWLRMPESEVRMPSGVRMRRQFLLYMYNAFMYEYSSRAMRSSPT